MLNILKKSKALIVVGLSMLTGIGVLSGLSINSSVEKVEASISSTTTNDFIYLDINDSPEWQQANAIFKATCTWNWNLDSGASFGVTATKLYDNFYKCYFPEYGNVQGAGVCRFDPNSSTRWNRAMVSGNDISKSQVVYIKAGGGDDNCNIVNAVNIVIKEIKTDAPSTTLKTTTLPTSSGKNKNVSVFASQLSTYSGYTFDGFYTASTGGSKVTTVNATTTIYARYTPDIAYYSLGWDYNGGTVKTAGTPAGTYESGTTITAPVLTKTGYTFTGWNPTFNPTLTADVTYAAQWEVKKDYYLVGNFNDWTVSDDTYKMTKDSTKSEWSISQALKFGDTFMIRYIEGTNAPVDIGYNGNVKTTGDTNAWNYRQIVAGSDNKFKAEANGTFSIYYDSSAKPGIYIGRVTLDDAYYLVGSFNNWTPTDAYKFKTNESTPGEFMLTGVTLNGDENIEEGIHKDQFKIYGNKDNYVNYYGFKSRKYIDGSAFKEEQIVGDYGGDSNYQVDVTGKYDFYFNPNGGDGDRLYVPAITVTKTYTIKVGDGSPITLIQNSQNPNEYITESAVSVAEGDTLAAYENGKLMTMHAKAVSNNNCKDVNNVTTVISPLSGKLVVDIINNTIFAGGYSPDIFIMRVFRNNTYIIQDLIHNENPGDPDNYYEYFTQNEFLFMNEDVIDFVDTTTGDSKAHAVVFSVGEVDKASLSDNFVPIDIDDEKKITVENAPDSGVSSRAYLKLGINTEAGHNMVYFGNVDIEEAVKFAKAFIAAIDGHNEDGVCDGNGHTDPVALKNKWTGMATKYATDLENHDDAKLVLQNATVDSPYSALAQFAALYNYVYQKYAGSVLENNDFANRFPGIKFQQGANRNWTKLESEDQTILIVVIASASLLTLSAGALAILLKKKKKVK